MKSFNKQMSQIGEHLFKSYNASFKSKLSKLSLSAGTVKGETQMNAFNKKANDFQLKQGLHSASDR